MGKPSREKGACGEDEEIDRYITSLVEKFKDDPEFQQHEKELREEEVLPETTKNRLLCAAYKDKDGRYLLDDSVRVLCGGIQYPDTPYYPCEGGYYYVLSDKPREERRRPCPICRTAGWTPSEDAWVWLASLRGVPVPYIAQPNCVDRVLHAAVVSKEVFYAALESALRPLAVNVEEANELVKGV